MRARLSSPSRSSAASVSQLGVGKGPAQLVGEQVSDCRLRRRLDAAPIELVHRLRRSGEVIRPGPEQEVIGHKDGGASGAGALYQSSSQRFSLWR